MGKSFALSFLLIGVFVLLTVFIFTAGERQISYLFEHNTGLMIIGSIVFFGFVPILLFALPWIPRYFKRKWLLANGVAAKARITGIADTSVTVNNSPVVRLSLHVKPDAAPEFDAEARHLVSRLAIPKIGDMIVVVYDPNKPTDLVILPGQSI
jgi:hypothetical protein